MIAEISPPKFRNVALLPWLPSWTPRPGALPPSKRATIGLMMLEVNAAIRALKASATASPTATVTMSPRMMKFLNPVNTPEALPSRPRRLRAVICGGAGRPAVDADDIVPDLAKVNEHARYGSCNPCGY